jgi:hypothetical protein
MMAHAASLAASGTANTAAIAPSTHLSSWLQKSSFPQPLLQSSLCHQPLHLSRVSTLAVHFRLRHRSYRQLLLSCHRPICSNELLNKLIHVDDFQPSQEPVAFN